MTVRRVEHPHGLLPEEGEGASDFSDSLHELRDQMKAVLDELSGMRWDLRRVAFLAFLAAIIAFGVQYGQKISVETPLGSVTTEPASQAPSSVPQMEEWTPQIVPPPERVAPVVPVPPPPPVHKPPPPRPEPPAAVTPAPAPAVPTTERKDRRHLLARVFKPRRR